MAKEKITQSQLQSALSLAKHSATAHEARRKPSLLNRAELAGDPQLRENRRATRNLARVVCRQIGPGPRSLRADQRDEPGRPASCRRRPESRCRQAVARHQAGPPSTGGRPKEGPGVSRKPGCTPPAPTNVVLDSPILIWPTAGLVVDSSSIEPWNSRAKFRIQSSNSNGSPALSFWYIWVNRGEKFALINVAGMLIVNGFCLAGSDGGGCCLAFGSARGHRRQPGPSGRGVERPQTSPIQNVVFLSTNTGGWFDSNAIDWQTVFDGYILQFSELIVPPGELVLIEVVLTVNYVSADGNVDVDFSSGEFNVMSPFAAVTVLSSRRHPPPRVDG